MNLLRSIKSAVAGAFVGFRAGFGPYSDATSSSADRGANVMYFLQDHDTRQYLPSWTRRQVLTKVDWLFQNFGIVKEACRGIARHTVGKGICLSLNTDDEEWNALAEADVEAYFLAPDRFDLAGRRNGYDSQNFAVFQRIKQGEWIAAAVPNPRWGGAPCLQVFDANEIQTPDDRQDDPYVVDGFELDVHHCMVAIHVRGLDGKFSRISREQVLHWYFADAANQPRGVSELAQAVAPMADVRELVRIVTKTAKQNSAIGLHIKKLVKAGGQGGIGKLKARCAGGPETTDSDSPRPQYEKLSGGGAVIYTDEDGDAKFLTPNSPSPLVEPFIRQVLMRDGLSSLGGASADFFWACADLSGAGQRFIMSKADVFFSVLGDGLIGHMCNPITVRYLLHRMETGKLRRPRRRILVEPTPEQLAAEGEGMPPAPREQWVEDADGEWMNHIGWQLPARLSIDRGDATVEIAQLNAGVETLSTINDRRGRGWRSMVKQWFREFAYAAKVAAEMKAEWALKSWRAGMPGASTAAPEDKPDPEDDKPKPAAAA